MLDSRIPVHEKRVVEYIMLDMSTVNNGCCGLMLAVRVVAWVLCTVLIMSS